MSSEGRSARDIEAGRARSAGCARWGHDTTSEDTRQRGDQPRGGRSDGQPRSTGQELLKSSMFSCAEHRSMCQDSGPARVLCCAAPVLMWCWAGQGTDIEPAYATASHHNKVAVEGEQKTAFDGHGFKSGPAATSAVDDATKGQSRPLECYGLLEYSTCQQHCATAEWAGRQPAWT